MHYDWKRQFARRWLPRTLKAREELECGTIIRIDVEYLNKLLHCPVRMPGARIGEAQEVSVVDFFAGGLCERGHLFVEGDCFGRSATLQSEIAERPIRENGWRDQE